MSVVGVVAIGRNEGDRLQRCLESAIAPGRPVVYVDSGSTDGSVELARCLGVDVVELDPSKPFSAARARNEGVDRLVSLNPDAELVQLVDGDCEIMRGWVERASEELAARGDVAVVCGRRRERHPGASIYNALCDLEWNGPAGETDSCGGDAMVRVAAFREVGGLDVTVPAGEEPEFCQRLRQREWKIVRLDEGMTWHDAAMTRFSQWWRRQVRTGYSGLDVARRFGMERFARQVRSARIWTVSWTGALLVSLVMARWIWWTGGAIGLTLLLAGMAAQMLRIGMRRLGEGVPPGTAAAYAALTVLGKWAQLVGHVRYYRDHRDGRRMQLIEYKGAQVRPVSNGGSAWQEDLRRYPRRPWLKEQSIWAIAVYRFGRWNDAANHGAIHWVLDRFYWLAFRVTETLTGISFNKHVEIGPGFRIHHFGGIFIHQDVRIGANCTLRQGITIGNRVDGGRVPVIEDDVDMGAYAQVLGDVRIGRGAKIGAMSVVLTDVPPGATAVGVPARIVETPAPERARAIA